MTRHVAETNTFASTSVKVTLTGAIPGADAAIFAPTVSAASDSDWDYLAQCESGDNWHINTGNGYYGGLQFSADTWNAFGDNEFASTADQASREEQIYAAEKALIQQDQDVWPTCSASLGLSSGPTGRPHPSQDATPIRAQTASTAAASDSKTDLIQQFANHLSNVNNLSNAQTPIAEFRVLTDQVELPQRLIAATLFDLSKLRDLI